MKGNKRKAECEKTNRKFIGAFFRTRPQKGITLIALIITIIVMLILVGVTISVALNGGLFTQAQTAVSDTQKEADKEQLLSAVVGAIGTDAKVDFDKLDNNLPKDWTGSNGTYTSPNGNTFKVDENGTIKEPEKNNSEKYSFKLSDLGNWSVGINEGWIEFDAEILWDEIGKNLYDDEKYKIDSGQLGNWLFSLETDNSKLINGWEVILGKETASETDLLVAGHVFEDEQDKFYIQVLNSSFEDGLSETEGTELMTFDEFMDTYKDTIFTFVENTEFNF